MNSLVPSTATRRPTKICRSGAGPPLPPCEPEVGSRSVAHYYLGMRMRGGVVVGLFVCLVAGAPARAERIAAVAASLPRSLVVFDTATPAVFTLRSITGLGSNESIVGLDLRPA